MKRPSVLDYDDEEEGVGKALLRAGGGRAGWAIVLLGTVGLLLTPQWVKWFGSDERSTPIRSSFAERPTATVAAPTVTEELDRAQVPTTESPPPTTVASTTVASTDDPPRAVPPAASGTSTVTVSPSTDAVPTDPPTTQSTPESSVAGPSSSSVATNPGASVVAILYSGSIKLSGAVPTQTTAEDVFAFVMRCARSPAWIASDLNIDPRAPSDVSVRLIDLTSSVFAAGSSSVAPDHARELDHIGSVLQSMPEVSVSLIGHLDRDRGLQRSGTLGNARARADIDYLVDAGVAPGRLSMISSDAVGTPGGEDSVLALALAGRTEFIFSGLASS